MRRSRPLRAALAVVALILLGTGAFAAMKLAQSHDDAGRRLAIRWEGAVIDKNTRDVGRSLNECLGRAAFAEGRLQRSSMWFSGWSCEDVGNPDAILSLNYKPHKGERFYCRRDGKNVVGLVSGSAEELNDLEFVDTWRDPTMRDSACWYVREGLEQLANGRRLLVHCDAGRDRTGTYSALLAALAAERTTGLDSETIAAIECDYRKSASLVADKYGRMERFLTQLKERGGVATFLREQCHLDEGLLDAASLLSARHVL